MAGAAAALAAVAVASAVAVGVVTAGAAAVVGARAAGIADAAARAAADTAAGLVPGTACERAVDVAAVAGAAVVACDVVGTIATVRVRLGSGVLAAEARARAGPPPGGG